MKKKLIFIATFTMIIFILVLRGKPYNNRPNYFSLNSIANIELNFHGDTKDLIEKTDKKKVMDFLNNIEYKPIKIDLRPMGGYINYISLKNKNGAIQHIRFYVDKVNYCLIKNDNVIKEKWYEDNGIYFNRLEEMFESIY